MDDSGRNPRPIIRKDADRYSMRWKIVVTAAVAVIDYAFVAGLKVLNGDSWSNALASPSTITAGIATAGIIVIIYYLFTPSSPRGSSRT